MKNHMTIITFFFVVVVHIKPSVFLKVQCCVFTISPLCVYLDSSLCSKCVSQRCRVLRLKKQLNDDYKEVFNLLKRNFRYLLSELVSYKDFRSYSHLILFGCLCFLCPRCVIIVQSYLNNSISFFK